jgi:hypothetical protein
MAFRDRSGGTSTESHFGARGQPMNAPSIVPNTHEMSVVVVKRMSVQGSARIMISLTRWG